MRTIKELLTLMKEHPRAFTFGLCDWVSSLLALGYITYDENDRLRTYVKSNRPSMFSSLDAFKHITNVYYWNPCKIEPRLKWIDKHIKLNS